MHLPITIIYITTCYKTSWYNGLPEMSVESGVIVVLVQCNGLLWDMLLITPKTKVGEEKAGRYLIMWGAHSLEYILQRNRYLRRFLP